MSDQNAWLRRFVVDNLNIDKEEIKLASEKYDEIDEFLEGETFLSGSRARHTATKPLNDIDIIWILDSKSEQFIKNLIGQDQIDIKSVLKDLEQHLKRRYQGTSAKIIIGQHSVGIYFTGDKDGFSADIVPAIPQKDGKFKIPKTGHMSVKKRRQYYAEADSIAEVEWILSHPKAYIKECKELDEKTDGNFRHAVRFVKAWRRACKLENDSIKLKSFHLECVVAEIFKENTRFSRLEAVEYFFKNLEWDYLQEPVIPDKAGGRNIDDYITEDPEFDVNPIKPFLTNAQSVIHRMKQSNSEEAVADLARRLTQEPQIKVPNPLIGLDTVNAKTTSPYFFSDEDNNGKSRMA